MNGMSVGAIPLTAIFEYTQFYPFTQDEAYFFVEVIRAVDNAYVNIISTEQRSRQGTQASSSSGRVEVE